MEQGRDTFKGMYSKVTSFVQDTSATFQTIVKDSIGQKYEEIASAYDWSALRRLRSDLTWNSASPYFYLPAEAAVILCIVDTQTNIPLDPARFEEILYGDPAVFDQQGLAVRYGEAGEMGRMVDFHTAAEAIRVVSSSAADTNLIIRIMGRLANEVEVSVPLTLNGTTNVDSTDLFAELSSGSIEDSHVGTITISGVTSGLVYARIAPSEKTAYYKRLRVSRPPTSANLLAVLYKKGVRKLINDQDMIEIPIANYLVEIGKSVGHEYHRRLQEAEYHRGAADGALAKILNQAVAGTESVARTFPQSPPRFRGKNYVYRP